MESGESLQNPIVELQKLSETIGYVFEIHTIRFVPNIVGKVQCHATLRMLEIVSEEWCQYVYDSFDDRVLSGTSIILPQLDCADNIKSACDQFKLLSEFRHPVTKQYPQQTVISLPRNAFEPGGEFADDSEELRTLRQQKLQLIYFVAKLVHQNAQSLCVLKASVLQSVHNFFHRYFVGYDSSPKYIEYCMYWVASLKSVSNRLKVLETDILWEDGLRYRNFEDILEAASGLIVLKVHARSLLMPLQRFSQPTEVFFREYPSIRFVSIAAFNDPDTGGFVDNEEFSRSLESLPDLNIRNQLPNLQEFQILYADGTPFEVTDVKFLPPSSRRFLRWLSITGVRKDLREILPTFAENLQQADVGLNFDKSPASGSEAFEDFEARLAYLLCAVQDSELMPRLRRINVEITLPRSAESLELRAYADYNVAALICLQRLRGTCYIDVGYDFDFFKRCMLRVPPSPFAMQFRKLQIVVRTPRNNAGLDGGEFESDQLQQLAEQLINQTPRLRTISIQDSDAMLHAVMGAVLKPERFSLLFLQAEESVDESAGGLALAPLIIQSDNAHRAKNRNFYESLRKQVVDCWSAKLVYTDVEKVIQQWVQLEAIPADQIVDTSEPVLSTGFL